MPWLYRCAECGGVLVRRFWGDDDIIECVTNREHVGLKSADDVIVEQYAEMMGKIKEEDRRRAEAEAADPVIKAIAEEQRRKDRIALWGEE